ncbi:MAG: hypothetical protein NVS9B15_14950 [Acidobacteriaceae bacterium]
MLIYISDSSSHTTVVTLDAIMAGALSSICVADLLLSVRSRRRRILKYMRQVESLNHNVRNALQMIVLHAEATAEERASFDTVRHSVRRIDETLRDAFPIIGDRKTDQGRTFHDLTD